MAHTKVTKTYSQNTGTANTFSYSGSFDVFKATEVVALLDNVKLTYTASTINESASPREYSVDTAAKTIHIGGANLSSGVIIIRPETDMGAPTPRADYSPGASITSEDLNNNQLQLMRKAMEYDEQKLSSLGDTMTGDLTMGEDTKLIFEGATDDGYETTFTVTDPTADRTITLPNVTGTVVTTGDTGTVAHAMLAGDAVDGDNIADNSVNSEHYVDGSIDLAHLNSSSVDSSKIVDDSIVNADINSSAAIAHSKLANITDGQILVGNGSNVPTAVAVSGDVTLANDGAVTIATGAVEHAMLAGDAVDGDNIADDVVNSEHIAAGAVDLEHMSANSVDSDQYVDGSIDHVHLAADIIDGDNIQDDVIDSEHYVAGSIDNEHLADDAVGADELAADAVVNASVAAGAAIAHSKLANVTDGQILVGNGSNVPTAVAVSGDVTIANTGAVTIANDSVEIGMIGCEQTTITDSDSHIPTSGAVVDYVASVIAPIGGLEVIDDDESFPNTIPAAGVVISITDAAGLQVNSSGVSTNGDTLDNSTVTINGFPSELRGGVGSNADPYVFQSGAGLMVVSTGSSQTYNYHQAMIRESDFVQLSDDINDFNSRYRIHAGEPSSNNDDGDMVWDTNANKMKVYDGTGSAWKEVTSTGDFKFLVAVDAGTTTAATFDGSDTSFDLKEATNSGSAASISNINQLMVVLNGVVQKPNAGSWSGSGEGFYLTDSDTIRFATAPPTGSTCFIVQSGSAVSIPTPGDGTVTAAKIANGAVVTAGIGADAVDGTKIADDSIDSEHIAAGGVDLEHMSSQSVDEDNLYISNAGTNGQFLQKQSGNNGGLTWADGASEGTSVKSTGETGGTKFLREDGDGTCSWQTVTIPKLATPIISGDTDIADAGTLTHTITNYDSDLTYTFAPTNCTIGTINTGNGQYVVTETGDHPSYTVKTESASLGLDDSALATKTMKTKLSAPTLSSPADNQTATNVVYTITSTHANDNKLILDIGSSNFTYQSVSHGSGSKVGNTVEVTGFSTNNPAVTIQFTAQATYSVTAKAIDTGGTWADSVSSSADSIVIQNTTGPFNYLVIAGGASGGTRGGGGGAGGMRSSWNSETSGGGGSSESEIATLNIGTVYTIDIGTGGASVNAPTWSQGTDGADSSISGTGLTTITSEGGGGGGDSSPAYGRDGGSGGGGGLANATSTGGTGTANQGYPGGNGNPGGSSPSGGGGGAGGAGTSGTPASPSPQSGPGGPGLASTISGSSVTYAGGGGGAAHTTYNAHGNGPGSPGSGGSGGGGAGSASATHGTAGTDGLGAGGGGAYGGHNPWYNSGKGGDGTVYLRMATSIYSGTQTNGTVTTSGSDTIIRWTQDGTYTA